VLDRARIGLGEVVLDVRTRAGLLALGALDRVGSDGSVIALDDSVDCLDALRAAHPDPRFSFLVGDAEVVPLPDASVDVVLGRSAVGSVHGKQGAALELYRVLARGGRISLFEPVDPGDAETWFADAGFAAIDAEQGQGLFLAGTKP